MKNNLPLIFVVILAILAGFVYWKANYAENKDKRLNTELISAANLTGVDEIRIKGDKEPLVLKKMNDIFVITGDDNFPARAGQITELFDNLTSTKLERVVTKKKDNHKDFGIEGGKTLQILGGGKPILDIVIGSAREGGGQYVAFAGEDKVYLGNKTLTLATTAEEWLYKNLFNIPRKSIKEIKITLANPNMNYALYRAKTEENFKLSKNGVESKADNQADSALQAKLSSVTTNLIAPLMFAKKENVPMKPMPVYYALINYELFNGQKYSLKVGQPDAKNQSPIEIVLDPRIPTSKNTDEIECSKWFVDNYSKYSFYVSKVELN